MSERERQIMNTIIEGLPKMSEFEKGYVLGMVESKASDKEAKDKTSEMVCSFIGSEGAGADI